MASCLGLYIEENIIKYAKITKDNEIIKIDSFGIKFYDKLNEAIEQVIEETYSYKIPISVNLANENYNYFYVFNQLSKKDMHNYIKTEFESICFEQELDVNSFDTRYVLVDELDNLEKVKAIHISSNKGDVNKRAELLNKYKLVNISPLGLGIVNLLEISKMENSEGIAIVNIEDFTTITTIINHRIYDVTTMPSGTREILSKINMKENSYAKAYEVCKNSTIYTSEGSELQYEENSYLDDIMPTLFNIVGRVKKLLNDSLKKIEKVYITGTASVINNIDIYFQEYLEDVKCEILKPYFIKNLGTNINIKDYIEVNSAIAMALQGLNVGVKGVNFKKDNISSGLPEWMNIDTSKISEKLQEKGIDIGLSGELKPMEVSLIKSAVALGMLVVLYGGLSIFLGNQMQNKIDEVKVQSTFVTQQAQEIKADTTKIRDRDKEYTQLIQQLNAQTDSNTIDKTVKYSIPNLLNQIMAVTPVGVQINKITIQNWQGGIRQPEGESTEGCKVTIDVSADGYDQIGLFTGRLKDDGILKNAEQNRSERDSAYDEIKAQIGGIIP